MFDNRFFKVSYFHFSIFLLQVAKDGSQRDQDIAFQSFHIRLNNIFNLEPNSADGFPLYFSYATHAENKIFETLEYFFT